MLILFTSDKGPWLGTDLANCQDYSMSRSNGLFRGVKQDVLEGGIRVPAILNWSAGLPKGRYVGEMIHFCDWLPTLLSAAGIQASSGLPLDGVDILPVLRGQANSIHPKRFWQFTRYEPVFHCNAAMRDGDWKLFWPRIPAAMSKMTLDNLLDYSLYPVAHFETEIDPSPVQREMLPPDKSELYHLAEDP
jgi:arylsulfatase A-like enzyme